MFPDTSIPSYFSEEEFKTLVKLLSIHYSYPLPYSLAGTIFEDLFAVSINGVRETKKLLFDVHKGDIGWSLKTRQYKTKVSPSYFTIVLQRCDIFKNTSLSINSPEDILGEQIIKRFSAFCLRSSKDQKITDPRSCFLLRNVLETDFILFQQRYRLYTAEEIKWKWENDDKNSLMGYYNGDLVYSWYRSGAQLFGRCKVPDDAHVIKLNWKKLTIDEAFAMISKPLED